MNRQNLVSGYKASCFRCDFYTDKAISYKCDLRNEKQGDVGKNGQNQKQLLLMVLSKNKSHTLLFYSVSMYFCF
ncbi:MAG: hypothetical protein BHW39_10230 [Firmicutes bacterium CAG:552_39_19]|nr:MAG: hypothetical protein BHW39_10230 [Firmicutes bacterium CAG:552_39_19]